MSLNAQQILEAQDIKVEKLYIPEWGGEVFVKTLTGAERDQLESELIQFSPNGNVQKMKLDKIRTLLAFLSLCDETGTRLYTDEADREKLSNKSASALDRIATKAQKLAGMSQADITALTDGLKNGQPAASPSA